MTEAELERLMAPKEEAVADARLAARNFEQELADLRQQTPASAPLAKSARIFAQMSFARMGDHLPVFADFGADFVRQKAC